MDNAIETAGMIATGGILAREVERLHAPGHDPSGACANCGTPLAGPFCSTCGQHGHVHRTAGALIHDILHGVFHFEGKFWSTLPRLAFRPGDLTRRYVHGERAKFVSPMAMFLFSVFLLFAVVANLPGWSFGDGGGFMNGNVEHTIDSANRAMTDARGKIDENIARYAKRLAEERARTPIDRGRIDVAERRLAKAQAERADVMRAQSMLPSVAAERKASTEPSTWLEQKYKHAKENPKLLFYKIKSSAYKFSWALIPISLPFIWILFPLRRGVGLYDHAIFATYSLSFMSLMVVVLGLLGAIGVPGAILILTGLIIPPIHMYRQFKGAYQLTRLGALWRTFWMVNFTAIITPLFGLMLLYLGVAD